MTRCHRATAPSSQVGPFFLAGHSGKTLPSGKVNPPGGRNSQHVGCKQGDFQGSKQGITRILGGKNAAWGMDNLARALLNWIHFGFDSSWPKKF